MPRGGAALAFTVGDIVILASGGPNMAIESTAGEQINCVWMTGGAVFRDTFLKASLKEVSRSRPVLVLGELRDEDKNFLADSLQSSDLAVGDIVVVKGSMDQMTIEHTDDSTASCVWFTKAKSKRSTFLKATLESKSMLDRRTLVVGSLLD